MWPSVEEELRAFVDLVWFAFSVWSVPWKSQVYQTDASLSGWSVSICFWNVGSVKSVGRVPERARYRLGAGAARSHALLDVVEGPEASTDASLCDGSSQPWAVDPDFPEVCPALLQKQLWKRAVSGKWAYDSNILILEGCACLKAVERIASTCSDCRTLILGDNMAAVLAFGRCRARDHKLLLLVRRMAAFSLSRGIRFFFDGFHLNEMLLMRDPEAKMLIKRKSQVMKFVPYPLII